MVANDKDNAKRYVAEAKQLAKKHGVDVLGWNDKPGREFISVNGEGDRLIALRKELETHGWHTWAVEEAQKGAFMDFARRSPPADCSPKPTDPGITEVELDPSITAPSRFHYAGPNALFWSAWPVFCGLPFIMFAMLVRRKLFLSTATITATAAFMVIQALLLNCYWIEISADNGTLFIRKHFHGKTKTMNLANIKSAKIFRQTRGRRGRRTTDFIAVKLKSGKSFDLFLPPKNQTELVALIKQHIENAPSQEL